MSLTPDQLELLRGGILLQLHAADPSALRESALLANVRLIHAVKGLDQETLLEQLRYLATKQMVEQVVRPLSNGQLDYRITPAGRAYLDSQNLI